MTFVKVFETEDGRVLGYDSETHKINFGYPPEWDKVESDIVKIIMFGFMHGDSKLETLKTINDKYKDKYGARVEFYAEGILSGMALNGQQIRISKKEVRKCTL